MGNPNWKRTFKFNNGNGAVLCGKCSTILYTGKDFTEQEWKAVRGELDYYLDPLYCDDCLNKLHPRYWDKQR